MVLIYSLMITNGVEQYFRHILVIALVVKLEFICVCLLVQIYILGNIPFLFVL